MSRLSHTDAEGSTRMVTVGDRPDTRREATYDMCKAVDRGMAIEGIRLRHKAGGRSHDRHAAADSMAGNGQGTFGYFLRVHDRIRSRCCIDVHDKQTSESGYRIDGIVDAMGSDEPR
jgi:hypothetical protein